MSQPLTLVLGVPRTSNARYSTSSDAAPKELDQLRLESSGGGFLTQIPALLCKANYAYSLETVGPNLD